MQGNQLQGCTAFLWAASPIHNVHAFSPGTHPRLQLVRQLTRNIDWLCQGCAVWVPFGAANWPAKVISIASGATGTAVVQLYASGISTEVDAAGLTAFADGYEQKCKSVQSQLGRQVRLLYLNPAAWLCSLVFLPCCMSWSEIAMHAKMPPATVRM